MENKVELDRLLEQHRVLRKKLPHAWNAFFARFGQLRPVQLVSIPPVLAGKNVLITAPTAGGKTEAVAAPVSERLAQERWPGLSVLLVTPTRALVNDLFQRLSGPCANMGVQLARKTADHALDSKSPGQFLITTPESTESLLTFRREVLANIRVVVMDEIHLLDGTPRGDQMRCLLGRLNAYLRHSHGDTFGGLQRIAMSATVSDTQRLAQTYLGREFEIVSVPGQRQIDARILCVPGEDQSRIEAAIEATSQFQDVRKILVFVNSRKQVDLGTSHFKSGRFARTPVYGHHGSLSKAERENVESRFKSDSQAICVATMTLEVGIDIGDIDLVICMDPPFSLSSFLQRIGRGCRRLQGLTRVLCVARDRPGELMFEALASQSAIGMPAAPLPPFRRSVLVQQVLAYLRQVDKNIRITDQFLRVFESELAPSVDAGTIQHVLADMVRSGLLDLRGGVFQPASAGRDFIESEKIYGNIQPSPVEVKLIDVETGNTVASVAGFGGGTGLRVAGRSYDVLPGSKGRELRVREGGDHVGSPRYHARGFPYAFDIGATLAAHLGIEKSTLAVVRTAESYFIFTWLGALLNRVLAAGLAKLGLEVTCSPFNLVLDGLPEKDMLDRLRQAVSSAVTESPLSQMKVERLADLGPHFELLSEDAQAAARGDWLDANFLTRWAEGLKTLTMVPEGSVLRTNLLALANS